MKIANRFVVDAPLAETWAFLTDIPSIMACLPGAEVSAAEDQIHPGSIKLRVGPVTAEYRGHAQVIEQDRGAGRIVLEAEGSDTRGNSNARARLTLQVHETDGATHVDLESDLDVTGVAQFGRGLMQEVSVKLLAQFSACLEVKLEGTRAIDAVAAASASQPSAVPLQVADEPLDLLTVAGSAVAKRVVPIVAIAFAALVVLLVLLF